MAEVTLSWPTARSTPINPEWETHTYSSSRGAAEAVIELGHDVYIGPTRTLLTVEQARDHLRIADQIKAERQERAAREEAERVDRAWRKHRAVEDVLIKHGLHRDLVFKVAQEAVAAYEATS